MVLVTIYFNTSYMSHSVPINENIFNIFGTGYLPYFSNTCHYVSYLIDLLSKIV